MVAVAIAISTATDAPKIASQERVITLSVDPKDKEHLNHARLLCGGELVAATRRRRTQDRMHLAQLLRRRHSPSRMVCPTWLWQVS